MSVEGLWTVEFFSTLSSVGKGVVVLINEKILGGDDSYWYSGSYKKDHNTIKGIIYITRFDPNAMSVFGNLERFSLEISVIVDGISLNGSAVVVENPELKLGFKGTKKVDL